MCCLLCAVYIAHVDPEGQLQKVLLVPRSVPTALSRILVKMASFLASYGRKTETICVRSEQFDGGECARVKENSLFSKVL